MRNICTAVIGRAGLVAGFVYLLLAGAAPPAHAASAVAAARDMTYGYAFNHADAESAQRAALRSCSRRTRAACEIVVSCASPGFGAISFRRVAGRGTVALGAACGARTVEDAYREAVANCNARGAGRCGHPRVAWNDRASGASEDDSEQ